MKEPHYYTVLRAYKKREKALQKRIKTSEQVNKRLSLLLLNAEQVLPNGLAKDMIRNQLKEMGLWTQY